MTAANFPSLPDRRAANEPDGVCLAEPGTVLTNRDFLERIEAASQTLRASGIGRGDVVALRLGNRIQFVVLMFASWRLGAAVTPVNPVLTQAELDHQLDNSGASLVISDAHVSSAINQLLVDSIPTERSGRISPPDYDPEGLALLVYTSGTTGKSKGVMLVHANIDAMASQIARELNVVPTDNFVLILPLFHVNGIVVSILAPLLGDARTTIMPRFEVHRFLEIVSSTEVTVFSAVPTILMMLDDLGDDVRTKLSSVRLGITGAAPCPPGLTARIERRFGFPVVEGYGLSEATCASTANTVENRKPGTVGRPIPGQEVQIANELGGFNPPGTDGEVLIKGPTVMRGYLGEPELTAQTISRDGWLRTGDIGHLDDDGYLVIVGRAKDMIIRGGENIYPREIEDVLSCEPAVQEAAVVGFPDEKFGEIVVAFVVAVAGQSLSVDRLHDLCIERLSPFKRPVDIRVVDELPKNATGKVQKFRLVET